jgi:hypothetical protein
VGRQPGEEIETGDMPVSGRHPCLSGFAVDGEWDECLPSAGLAAALEAASGAGQRCPGADRDELLGLLRQWQSLESWAAAAKLGVLRALVRDDDEPLPGGGYHGDLPVGWTRSLTHEVALALSMPAVSAEKQMWVAWDLEARLPGTGDLLAAGRLTSAKAKAVYEAFLPLSEANAARAEAMILAELPGKTYGQVQKLAVQAAVAVDPESAARRREDAEQHKSRIQMFREESGAAALSGRDLPTDQTLAAHASVCARAQEYKDSGAFPDDVRMDQFRVAAYLDLLNEIPAHARIASGQIVPVTRASSQDSQEGPESHDSQESPVSPESPESGATSGVPEMPEFFDPLKPSDSPGPSGPPAPPAPPAPAESQPESSPRLADLAIPLVTLLGVGQRPGEGHGLGPLDPDLCRKLAAAAIASPWTRLCLTVTDQDGIAIGHGCAKRRRRRKPAAASPLQPSPVRPSPLQPGSLPARLNLTITADQLARLAAPDGQSTLTRSTLTPSTFTLWTFTQTGDPGPPGGYGTWTLTLPDGGALPDRGALSDCGALSDRGALSDCGGLPDGRTFTVELEPVPTFECDHRHESLAYQPNDRLRHLVEIRDGECTFPMCARHARESDFEHTVAYDKGGRTCGCNAGARSRQCHQVKQSKGWHVTQPKPGWHQWETPTGRIYLQGPKRYPF